MSITAVPLQPVPKGALGKLWLGLAGCALLAAGFAYAGTHGTRGIVAANAVCGKNAFLYPGDGVRTPITTADGLRFQTVKAGDGPHPGMDDVALVGYKGMLPNGTVFDANPRTPLAVAAVVPGFSEALKLMQKGGSYRICIPPALGYGPQGVPGHIPANATLTFSVDLLDFKSQADLEAQMIQQQMQQQAGHPAAH
ncbi:MAG: FKBP-type peptidyl-prolyl cis-trans isomerase [Alphaproteobacteria bacterium]|nr:FKBP-type peptidyl-prolyl cis-trans isomerase [Alphaproteobacteria bacterium]MDE2041766.1 FKBP-type peptidyl-prolyl cis-trans isomerase [Alphaproteobacteria bacterium]